MTPAQIIARLESEQFHIGDAANDLDRAYRRGHNACAQMVLGWLHEARVNEGLAELRDAAIGLDSPAALKEQERPRTRAGELFALLDEAFDTSEGG